MTMMIVILLDEAEACVNMLEAELSHGNLCNPQLQLLQDQMEFWTHAQMVVWLCTNDGRCYMIKWNISAYNK